VSDNLLSYAQAIQTPCPFSTEKGASANCTPKACLAWRWINAVTNVGYCGRCGIPPEALREVVERAVNEGTLARLAGSIAATSGGR